MKNPDQSLIFPLNVYSALMRRYAGQVPFLSYGSLSESDVQALTSTSSPAGKPQRLASVLIEAQWRRADQIMSRVLPALPTQEQQGGEHALVITHTPAPLRVLEVGCGSGELARLLAERGYDVCALDNTPAIINRELADAACAGSLEFISCDFEKLEDQRGFDLLIFNNSTRYFLPLTWLYKAESLLRPGGQILVCEEFASNTPASADPDSLPVLDHVLALAQRLGFDVLAVDDLTDGTLRFQEIFIQLFGSALAELPAMTDLPAAVIENLYQALQSDKSAAGQGRRRHALISLRASPDTQHFATPDAVHLRNAADLAPAAFRTVFERSFDTDFVPELWAWKYHTGKAASVAAERNGVAIAHYGGVVRDIYYFAQPCRAVQICDVMVLPDERSFFSRNSLFFKTAASMLEQHVGYRANNLLGFGFPNLKAMHVAERLGLYEKTDELMQIALAPKQAGTPAPAASAAHAQTAGWQTEIIDFASVSALANQLWAQMLPAFADSIIGVRNAEYLHYRFVQRPQLAYECVKLSFKGDFKALAFRRPHYDGYLVMDIIAAPHDLAAALQCVLQPSETGKPSVFWLTAGQIYRVQRHSENLLITKTGILIPCNRWTRGPGTATLAGKWWLTAGDMDFL